MAPSFCRTARLLSACAGYSTNLQIDAVAVTVLSRERGRITRFRRVFAGAT